jgi:hypothetical protein
MSTRGDTVVRFVCAECELTAIGKLRELREAGWFRDPEGDELCQRCAADLGLMSDAQYRARLAYCTRHNESIRITTCDSCSAKVEGKLSEVKKLGWSRQWKRKEGTRTRIQIDLCPACLSSDKTAIGEGPVRVLRSL